MSNVEFNPAVPVATIATGATVGAAAGYLKEKSAIKALANAATTAKDYFEHSAKDSTRILDPSGCILQAAKKWGKIGLISGAAVAAGYAVCKFVQNKVQK